MANICLPTPMRFPTQIIETQIIEESLARMQFKNIQVIPRESYFRFGIGLVCDLIVNRAGKIVSYENDRPMIGDLFLRDGIVYQVYDVNCDAKTVDATIAHGVPNVPAPHTGWLHSDWDARIQPAGPITVDGEAKDDPVPDVIVESEPPCTCPATCAACKGECGCRKCQGATTRSYARTVCGKLPPS